MPSPRGRGSRARGSEEEFVLFLQGIPAHCRWQELKDLVRQTALHIRQAVVYDDHHGFPTGLGQIIVKNEDEAWRTYHRLSTNGWEGQSLVVTLARTSSPTCPIAGPTKSPSCVISPSYVAGYSTPPRGSQNVAVPPSPISPEYVEHAPGTGPEQTPTHGGPRPSYQPEYAAPMLPPMGFLPVFTDASPPPSASAAPVLRPPFDPLAFTTIYPPAATTYPPPPLVSHPHPHQQQPHHRRPKSIHTYTYTHPLLPYATTTTATAATRPPHRRTLFIQNLSPATTTKTLRTFLSDAGTVEQCEIPTDPDSGRCKGFARVTFRTADEAKRAVAVFNNAVFIGSKMRVKIDRSIQVAYTFAVGVEQSPVSAVPHHPPHPSPTQTQPPGQYQPRPGTGADSVPISRSESSSEREPTPRRQGSAPPATSAASPPSKPVDRCGPLVVNGSGVGARAVVT